MTQEWQRPCEDGVEPDSIAIADKPASEAPGSAIKLGELSFFGAAYNQEDPSFSRAAAVSCEHGGLPTSEERRSFLSEPVIQYFQERNRRGVDVSPKNSDKRLVLDSSKKLYVAMQGFPIQFSGDGQRKYVMNQLKSHTPAPTDDDVKRYMRGQLMRALNSVESSVRKLPIAKSPREARKTLDNSVAGIHVDMRIGLATAGITMFQIVSGHFKNSLKLAWVSTGGSALYICSRRGKITSVHANGKSPRAGRFPSALVADSGIVQLHPGDTIILSTDSDIAKELACTHEGIPTDIEQIANACRDNYFGGPRGDGGRPPIMLIGV